jgi:hypothetical protein
VSGGFRGTLCAAPALRRGTGWLTPTREARPAPQPAPFGEVLLPLPAGRGDADLQQASTSDGVHQAVGPHAGDAAADDRSCAGVGSGP